MVLLSVTKKISCTTPILCPARSVPDPTWGCTHNCATRPQHLFLFSRFLWCYFLCLFVPPLLPCLSTEMQVPCPGPSAMSPLWEVSFLLSFWEKEWFWLSISIHVLFDFCLSCSFHVGQPANLPITAVCFFELLVPGSTVQRRWADETPPSPVQMNFSSSPFYATLE